MRRVDKRIRVVWVPTQDEVSSVVRKYFRKAASDFYVIRTRTVSLAVAAALGTNWSPALGALVKTALAALGGRPILFNHVHLTSGVIPAHFDEAEARDLAIQLRGRKDTTAAYRRKRVAA